MRIWLALARASILWLSERSGAAHVFEDVVPVAVTMGGESTHRRRSFKTKCANSPRPQPEVQLNRGCWTVATVFAGVFGGFTLLELAQPKPRRQVALWGGLPRAHLSRPPSPAVPARSSRRR